MKIATRGGWPLRPAGDGAAGDGEAASASGGVTCSGAGTPECSDAPTATALHLRASDARRFNAQVWNPHRCQSHCHQGISDSHSAEPAGK
jgi:hypothetical protein